MEVATAISTEVSPSGFKKVFSKASRSRTSVNEVESNGSRSPMGPRASIDSALDKVKSRTSAESSRGEESSKSGSSGLRKLVTGHRKRRRKRDEAKEKKKEADDEVEPPRGRSIETTPTVVTQHSELNASQSTLDNDAESNFLTEDEAEPESPRPPLTTRASHAGYATASSPLIHASTVSEIVSQVDGSSQSTHGFRPQTAATLTSSESAPAIDTATVLRHANTLGAPDDISRIRRKSIAGLNALRGISPGYKLKEAFAASKGDKSPNISPDRESVTSSINGTDRSSGSKLKKHGSLSASRPAEEPPPVPKSVWIEQSSKAFGNANLPNIVTTPTTPPSAGLTTPLTTVTPPTPTLEQRPGSKPSSPRKDIPVINVPDSSPTGETIVSVSGNMISHRRVRSTSAVNQPSRLSNAIYAPLTPTIEEKTPSSRTPSGSVAGAGGFFSSVFSAAQNAATTLTNTLNTQNRNRSGTQTSEPEKEKPKATESSLEDSSGPTTDEEPTEPKKPAVETLGMGDLNFSHLGIDSTSGSPPKEGKASSVESADLAFDKGVFMKKDDAVANMESVRAARAVSAAYDGKPLEDGFPTPIAEDVTAEIRPRSTFGTLGGEQTPPNGSVFESEVGTGPKRSNSVRSKITRRRHRGSSGGATGSTIGAMVGASTSVLANPAAQGSNPRLTGFAVASKKRNRDFHQLFRSVPEDDYLIEDYSCALQREIILAGRIYISEGHICFSSNILGWVTTLVISFDEVMSVEKENTAVVFPNAIAIQTLHARHTFRSLLSRESTYDLLINIWKVSHPSLISSANGSRLEGPGTGDKTEKHDESDAGSDVSSEEEDEIYDEDAEDEGVGSFTEAGEGSVAGSEAPEIAIKPVSRKASAIGGPNGTGAAQIYPQFSGDTKAGEKAGVAGAEASADYPGPSTHAPTECADGASHYERMVRDETIPAPLGKIYSMMFGPASGTFLTKFLLDDVKVLDLHFEKDDKGLGPGTETRTYDYIKPLNASIGPKQTKCITTEALDAFDLDKAVSVTMTTQTPDVPSGNVFSVKTKYCLSWAAGNATRVQMNCAIEWTGKSWLKGPIEGGANSGQATYATDLIKALRAGIAARPRAGTSASKGTLAPSSKTPKGKRRKGDGGKAAAEAAAAEAAAKAKKEQEESWGLFDPLRGVLGPAVSIAQPLITMQVVVGILGFLVLWLWWRGPSTASLARQGGYPAFASTPERLTAYEAMWRHEEGELWDWLDQRVGMGDGMGYPKLDLSDEQLRAAKKARSKTLGKKGGLEAKLREEKMSEREMEDAIRVTQERLDLLRGVVEKKKEQRQHQDGSA